MEAQQCVKLTSTNRPFGLIIKLSQTVFEEENPKQVQAQVTREESLETLFLHSGVRLRVELVRPAKFCCRTRDAMPGMSRGVSTRVSSFRWSYREGHTRSHPEHGS